VSYSRDLDAKETTEATGELLLDFLSSPHLPSPGKTARSGRIYGRTLKKILHESHLTLFLLALRISLFFPQGHPGTYCGPGWK
jgi:hypothetical protein